MINTARIICFAILCLSFSASAEDFTNALHVFLQHRVEVEKRDVGIVVGIVDAGGSSIVSSGRLDNGTDQKVNGDTVFEIGSVTKTFTGLLLQDMVERGEMKLDDPVAKYLPKSVKVPSRNGKEITLLQLATHTSGLPTSSITWIPKRADDPRADYTVERMYEFVSSYELPRDPGTKYEYSTVGMALLGQAIALKAGTTYESLVIDRICRPLKMDSTRITLTPQLNARFAIGHNYCGYSVSNSYWGALTPGAGLRSTANDLLKYVSANLGLSPSCLAPLMKKTHISHFNAGMETDTGQDTDLGLGWMITHEPGGADIIEHGGLTDGFISFVCFDPARVRGVVVLCNSQDFDAGKIGRLLIKSDWQTNQPESAFAKLFDQMPKSRAPEKPKVAVPVAEKSLDDYIGRYEFATNTAFPSGAKMTIWREEKQLVGQIWSTNFIQGAFDVYPESETNFFLKINGAQLTFKRNDERQVIAAVYHSYRARFPDCEGKKFSDLTK
jgi:serine-type D-Ala-D-Ala carboxypeptidase/endopeptidase